jgi:hypothetical protein
MTERERGSGEDAVAAEANLDRGQKFTGEAQEKLLSEIRASSGLAEGVVDEIFQTYSIDPKNRSKITFRAKGHWIELNAEFSKPGLNFAEAVIDGTSVKDTNTLLMLTEKYGKLVTRLSEVDNMALRKKASQMAVAELLE